MKARVKKIAGTMARIGGFSLVEVTLAIGIVSFGLLAVVALLPVGLNSIKQANEQAGAANVLSGIASALRSAGSTDGTNFSSQFAGEAIEYQLGGAGQDVEWAGLTLDGEKESAVSPKRLSAVLNIVRTPTDTEPGQAVISVAWSAQAEPQWDIGSTSWSGADGSLTSAIQFFPSP